MYEERPIKMPESALHVSLTFCPTTEARDLAAKNARSFGLALGYRDPTKCYDVRETGRVPVVIRRSTGLWIGCAGKSNINVFPFGNSRRWPALTCAFM